MRCARKKEPRQASEEDAPGERSSTTTSNAQLRPGDEKGPQESIQSFRGEEAFPLTHPWIRHYEQGVPAHIAIPEHPLTWLLNCTIDLYPDHTAFIYYGTKLTYGMTCMNVSLLLGATMVLVPRFKPKEIVKTIRQFHPIPHQPPQVVDWEAHPTRVTDDGGKNRGKPLKR